MPPRFLDRWNDELKEQQDKRVNGKVICLNPRERELTASAADLPLKGQDQSRVN